MKAVSRVNGNAYPLGLANVDTDTIIPASFLTTITRTGLGKGAFQAIRAQPGNVFDDPRYADASIIVAGENFGCGSSREHAVWALQEFGIRAIIAESFAPIFKANCLRNGLLPISLTKEAIAAMCWQNVSVDLASQRVVCGSDGNSFDIDSEAKTMMLEGIDVIDLTLRERPAIDGWTQADQRARPWVYLENMK